MIAALWPNPISQFMAVGQGPLQCQSHSFAGGKSIAPEHGVVGGKGGGMEVCSAAGGVEHHQPGPPTHPCPPIAPKMEH